MLADRQYSLAGPETLEQGRFAGSRGNRKKVPCSRPQCRYASADKLRDDMERQLKHQPLRHAPEPSWRERAHKWVRRHPRLTSASSIAAVASVFVALLAGGLAYRGARLASFEAAENLVQFQNDLQAARAQVLDAPVAGQSWLEASREACRKALRRFGVIEHPDWQGLPLFTNLLPEQQVKTRADVGELLFLVAAMEGLVADAIEPPSTRHEHLGRAVDLNRRAEACYASGDIPGAVWQQRALLGGTSRQRRRGPDDREKAAARPAQSTRDFGMAACILTSHRRFSSALPLWRRAS